MEKTVKARRFWVMMPVAAALALVYYFYWPHEGGFHALLRAAVGTVVMLATATVVVLTNKRDYQ